MFSSRLAQSSRLVASTSAHPLRNLHASAALSSIRPNKSRSDEITAAKRREERKIVSESRRIHCVLGTKPGDPDKWSNCDLAKVLITPEDIANAPPIPSIATIPEEAILPKYTNFGLAEQDKHTLFEVLPELSQERTLEITTENRASQPKVIVEQSKNVQYAEGLKAQIMARIVDLRNANAKGIAFENRRRCIEAFSEPSNPNDTGRPEVQAALLTMQIRNLWDHLSRCKKDIANRRGLRMLVHKRAKILRYLKRVDADRYDRVLVQLGLEPEAVEGELNV